MRSLSWGAGSKQWVILSFDETKVSNFSFRPKSETKNVNKPPESQASIFFLDPGKGISGLPKLPKIETSDCPTIGPIVSGIIVTCRSALAIHWPLVCFTAAVARIPYTQSCQNKGQWRI